MASIAAATQDLEVGLLMYCAGADPSYRPFLAEPVESALSMVQRNCVRPVELCHHFAGPMAASGRGRHRARLVRRRPRRRTEHGRLRRQRRRSTW